MTMQAIVDPESTIFRKRRHKGMERWFVRVACNFLEPRVYGPFPAEQEAERFREGAEFELRKLLDCQLPHLSGDLHLPAFQLK
ncbi:MAG: hypothetical protein VST68_09490 [Nitrospirota bacterium]|nr:hypothetical protein [Nitrospirota bacterium]